MDISNFKTTQKGGIIVLYKQYPKIELTCKYYDVRAIAKLDGELMIDQNHIELL